MKRGIAWAAAVLMLLTAIACGQPASSTQTATTAPTNAPTEAPSAQTQETSATDAAQEADIDPNGVARFAGEYDLYCEEKDMYCQEFVVELDGSIHGEVEASGLTTFEGTVDADGNVTCEVPRLGGTMTGTINDQLEANVHFSVRASETNFEGKCIAPRVAVNNPASDASVAAEATETPNPMYNFAIPIKADYPNKLFAWDGPEGAALVFNPDGTYQFNYKDMIKETGTWRWQDEKLTVADRFGIVTEGSLDNGSLKLDYPSITSRQLVVSFTAPSSVWSDALGKTYAPENLVAAVETKPCNLTVNGANNSMTQFAADELMAAAQEAGVADAWTVTFVTDAALDEQAYAITIGNKTITIKGADDHGLMYGGFEVAEQLRLYGIEGIQAAEAKPYVLHRGFVLNTALDMRSPAYTTPSNSAQNNIELMWDIEYWHMLFDWMARYRCNAFTMKNVNPYPSMVKVEGYEDCCIDDVWKSNIPYGDDCKGDMTNVVRDADWLEENHTVIKKMTIDEKIEFWKEVMAYAKSRGITFSITHGNIYPYVESHHYGITDKKENPTTTDYYRKAVKTLINTYPDLMAVSCGTGENMSWSNDPEEKMADTMWVRTTFFEAILEALAETPDRQYEYPGEVRNVNYSSTHMYACAEPHLVDNTLAEAEEGVLFRFTCRNEDVFNMRWGDPDFMRAFVKNMPDQSKLWAFRTGSDGYSYAREYGFVDPEMDGQLYIQKHWFNYFLLFRFLFEPDMSEQRIADVFTHYYENETASDTVLKATSVAGKIIPTVTRSYYMANGDYTWFAEGCWTHPTTHGYIDIKNWMKGDTTYVDGKTMSIEEYAVALAKGETPDAQGRMLPIEVSESLAKLADDTLQLVEEVRTANPKGENLTFTQKEFWQQVDDDEAMAYLGLFYSEKILGAIDFRIYNDTQDTKYQESAIEHLEKSAAYFDQYAEIISSNYEPQRFARVGYFDVKAIAEEVHGDVEIVRNWTCKTIRPSYRPPDKSNYFGDAGKSADGAASDDGSFLTWNGKAKSSLVFNADGTYTFKYSTLVTENGTWKWEDGKLTVTDPNGGTMEGIVDHDDNDTLKLTYVAAINAELTRNFSLPAETWQAKLGTSGTYTPSN